MSFSEECTRLLRLLDAGLSVADAAAVLGISPARVYRLRRQAGCDPLRGKTKVTDQHRHLVVEEFGRSGVISRAAARAGLSDAAARRILVSAGLVSADTLPRGKASARARFDQLRQEGWSIDRAAREVGINPRTGTDWARGVVKSNNTRTYPDGTVVDSGTGSRYLRSMSAVDVEVSDRYLSLDDRLAIADGLINKFTLTAIAAGIGKHVSTVSREVRVRSIEGVYLPHQAHRSAAAARARPKACKLVTNAVLRAEVEQGLERKLSPEQISHRLVKDFPDDESMRVSHETIYQALYFQARGGLKREVQAALRTGRTRRKPQRRPDQRQSRFVDPMLLISERPAEVEDRAVPGHWESQCFCQAAGASIGATGSW